MRHTLPRRDKGIDTPATIGMRDEWSEHRSRQPNTDPMATVKHENGKGKLTALPASILPTHPPIPGVCHRRYRHQRSRRRRQYGLTIAR